MSFEQKDLREHPLHAFCIYGPQHVPAIRDILIPALAQQKLPAGRRLELHVLNYRDDQGLLAQAGRPGVKVHDWSSTREATHIGFAEGMNFLAESVQPRDCFLLVNPDSFPMGDCLLQLLETHDARANAGIIEARQWPCEHPKEYDPHSFETPWASGAFSLVSAAAFREVGAFDPIYFLYNEDVDLSWRMWLAGYQVIYEPNAVAAHFTGIISYRDDRFYYEHFFSSRNFLALAYKFFGEEGETLAKEYLKVVSFPNPFKEKVLDSYKALKPRIEIYSGEINSPHIKILGFNQYHEFTSL